MYKPSCRRRWPLGPLCVLMLLGAKIFAQSSGFSLAGIAEDKATGLRLAQVIVTVRAESGALRSAITDADGRFAIKGIPFDRATVTLSKPGYVATAFDGRAAGSRIELHFRSGDARTVKIEMSRGGVIDGSVRDQLHEPVDGAVVSIFALTVDGAFLKLDGSAISDDRGRYRFFGLPAGRYVVAASRVGLDLDSRVDTPGKADLDRILGALERQDPRVPSSISLAPQQPHARGLPVYYPDALDPSQAVPVVVAPGQEMFGVDITLSFALGALVEGFVVSPIQFDRRQQVSLTPLAVSTGTGAAFHTSTDAKGQFVFRDVPPGAYSAAAFAVDRPEGVGEVEYSAVVRIDVNGVDVTQVMLSLAPSPRLDGLVKIAESRKDRPGPDLATMRVSLKRVGRGAQKGWVTERGDRAMEPVAEVKGDGSFSVAVADPGTFKVTIDGLPSGYWPLSALYGQTDLLDSVVQLPIGLPEQRSLLVTISNRHPSLTVSIDNGGRTRNEAWRVVVMPADPALWGSTRRVRALFADSDYEFRTVDLPPGDYLIALLDGLEASDLLDQRFLGLIASTAFQTSLAQSEEKTIQLRVETTRRRER